jgi:flagellar capping protein FliD
LNSTGLGRDAVLFYGSQSGRPVVIRSPTNDFHDLVRGLTVTAHSASENPVVVTASRDLARVQDSLKDFVDSYNDVLDQIHDLTRFDASTGDRGPLIGESALRVVEREISEAVIQPVLGLAAGKNLASQLGIRLTATGRMVFDSAAFEAVAASDPETIRRIFTQARTLAQETPLRDFANGTGLDATGAGAELRIRRRNGTSFDVDLTGDVTVRDLLRSIKEASGNGGAVTATIAPSGRSILVTDSTSGTSAFRVEPVNGSGAYQKLGLDRAADSQGGATITGREIDLSRDPGMARRFYDSLQALLDTEDGLLQSRADFYQSEIDNLKSRADRKREQMAAREAQLRRQFAQLEVLMGQNQTTQARLAATLGSILPGGTR